MRMRRIIFSSVACPAVPYFSTLPHERYDFRKKGHWTKKMFRFSLQILSETFLILRRTERYTRVGTLIVATIYLQLIQIRYMFRRFTVLQCSHQHCVQPVASDVEVVGYL